MADFVIRKNSRFRESVPVRYHGGDVTGEGTLEELSLSGARIKGSTAVLPGMVLGLEILVPGEAEPLRVARATVQWVKDHTFGVELEPQREVAGRITNLIAAIVQKHHGRKP